LGPCVDFYEDRALCRDVRRKLELWLDPALLHTLWDPPWNQWKHLLGIKIDVDATFIQRGKYRKRGDAWELIRWETALPSRLSIQLSADFQQQLETAKTTHHRFGQYSRALDQNRVGRYSCPLSKSNDSALQISVKKSSMSKAIPFQLTA
jgi:hypothetical protein